MSDDPNLDAALAAMTEAEGAEETEVEAPAETTTEETEAPKEEPKAPKEERHARMIERLARREAQLLAAEDRIREAHAQHEQRAKELEAKASEVGSVEELRQMARRDPLALLERVGVDLEVLSRQLIHGEKPQRAAPEVEELRNEVRELIKAQKAEREQAEQAKRGEYEQARIRAAVQAEQESIASEIPSLLDEMPELSIWEPAELSERIFEEKRQVWQRTKKVVDTRNVAATLHARAKSIVARARSVAEKDGVTGKTATESPQVSKGKPGRTIAASTHGSRVAKTPSSMSDDERFQAALDLLEKSSE